MVCLATDYPSAHIWQVMMTLDRLAETMGADLIAALDRDAAERIARLRVPVAPESGSFFGRLASAIERVNHWQEAA